LALLSFKAKFVLGSILAVRALLIGSAGQKINPIRMAEVRLEI
jgi:hypothetical protein